MTTKIEDKDKTIKALEEELYKWRVFERLLTDYGDAIYCTHRRGIFSIDVFIKNGHQSVILQSHDLNEVVSQLNKFEDRIQSERDDEDL